METVAENQKQSKHTPGPWEYFEQRHWRGEKMYGCVRGGGVVIVNGCAPGGTEEDNANARLIAAAPELLEHLERMVNIATHPQATKAQIRQIALGARAAIAKAVAHD